MATGILASPKAVIESSSTHPRLLRVRDPFGKLFVQSEGSVMIDGRVIFDVAGRDA